MKEIVKKLKNEVKSEMLSDRMDTFKIILREAMEQLQEARTHVTKIEKRIEIMTEDFNND